MEFLVCFDHTQQGLKTLKTAQAHAEVWDADLVVIQTISRKEPLSNRRIQEAEEKLAEKVAEVMNSRSHETVLLVDSMRRGEQIVNFAIRENVDQIFLGIEKKSRVDKLIFGSTAQFVILRAPCPVLTVG